jgi:serine/threonine protein kinase
MNRFNSAGPRGAGLFGGLLTGASRFLYRLVPGRHGPAREFSDLDSSGRGLTEPLPPTDDRRVDRTLTVSERISTGVSDGQTTNDHVAVEIPVTVGDTSPEPVRAYRVLRRHKRGGLGSVFVVRDHRTMRDVALKKLRNKMATNAYAQRLIRTEALVTAQLQHPGIVPVYDVGLDDAGCFYYTMPFVGGRTLSEQIDSCRANRSSSRLSRVDVRRLLDIFRDVCNTVAYAHSKGVVHLDLKPSNIMVGEFGETILLDWGCAKRAGDLAGFDDANLETVTENPTAQTRSESKIVGTPAYMAPEQIEGRDTEICPATDIYQLGAVLYEILTGQPPHPNQSLSGILRRTRGVRKGEPWATQVRKANRRVSPALAAICGRAMAEKPTDRYRTVEELSRDVECWMADEPVSVYRAGAFSRALRWVRHHQTLATLVFASCCMLGLFHTQLLRLTMQERCNQLAHALVREVSLSVSSIDTLRSFFETRGGVSRDEFRQLSRPLLERDEQLGALEWIPVVREADRRSYEAAVREENWPSPEISTRFHFSQRSSESRLVEASERDVYYPVYYLEPFLGNEQAFGYDLGSSPDRLSNLKLAAESGSTTITKPMRLVQGDTGFLAVSPVTHDAGRPTPDHPEGYVLGVFKIDEVMASAWRNVDARHLAIQVFDVTEPDHVHLVWSNLASADSAPSVANATSVASPGLLSASRRLSLWNRNWLIVATPRLGFVFLYPFSRMTPPPELS